MGSLSKSPMIKQKFQNFDVSFIFDEFKMKKEKEGILRLMKKLHLRELEKLAAPNMNTTK